MKKPTTEGKKEKYFISLSRDALIDYLIDNKLNHSEVVFVNMKEILMGRRINKKNIVYGLDWFKVCDQDFIDSRTYEK
jgi:hypothetical protein